MIYFLVGPMGIGKNYMGEQLAADIGCEFVDGDSFISAGMAKKVASFKHLSLKDLDTFVTERLIPGISRLPLKPDHEGRLVWEKQTDLVIAQALYRKRHRDLIRQHFGEDCVFIQIKASLRTNLKRLLERKKGLRWALYGLLNRPFFQTKDLKYSVDNLKDNKVFILNKDSNP